MNDDGIGLLIFSSSIRTYKVILFSAKIRKSDLCPCQLWQLVAALFTGLNSTNVGSLTRKVISSGALWCWKHSSHCHFWDWRVWWRTCSTSRLILAVTAKLLSLFRHLFGLKSGLRRYRLYRPFIWRFHAANDAWSGHLPRHDWSSWSFSAEI